MTAQTDKIRATLNQLSSGQIRQRVHENMLSDEAREAAMAELVLRGFVLGGAPVVDEDGPFSLRRFLIRCWRGREKLWRTYWLVGIAGTALVMLIGWVVTLATVSPNAAGIFVILVAAPFQIFAGASIWQCAPNSSSAVWGFLARVCVLVGWTQTASNVVLTISGWTSH